MACLLPSLCVLCIWPALRPNTYVVYLDDGRQPHGWQRNWRRYCAEMRSHRKAIAALRRIEKRRAYQRKRRFFSVIGKEWAFEVGKQCQLRVPKGIRNIASTEIKSEVSNSNTKGARRSNTLMRFASHASSLTSVGGAHGAKKAGSLLAACAADTTARIMSFSCAALVSLLPLRPI